MAKRKKKAKVKSVPKKKPVKKAASKKATKKVVTKKATKKATKKPKVEVKVPIEPIKVGHVRDLPTEVKQGWVALFSGSGKEIVNTVECLGFWPSVIITNNKNKVEWDPDILKRGEDVRVVSAAQSKTANFLRRYAQEVDSKVTLHDWNKKIPSEFKSSYDITEGAPIWPVVSEPEPEPVVEVVPEPVVEVVPAPVVDTPKSDPIGEPSTKSKRWIAMFSQSGSEIASLSEALGYWPDVIVTNNSNQSKWDERVLARSKQGEYSDQFKVVVVSDEQSKTANFLHSVEGSKNSLITLHGWLRIIPADICNQYKIVNGHPSLINQYPDLKGKDPQLRWWADRDKYDKWYGSVVHDVVAEVDAGQIHAVNKRQLTPYEEMDCNPFDLFRQTSLNSWLKYFIKFPIK